MLPAASARLSAIAGVMSASATQPSKWIVFVRCNMRVTWAAICPGTMSGIKATNRRSCAHSRKLRVRQTRSQARGGARAWKKSCGDPANASSTLTSSEMRCPGTSRGRTGGPTGTLANRMTEQMAQRSSAKLGCLCCVGAMGVSSEVAGFCIDHRSASSARTDRGEIPSKCKCPNDKTSWIVRANSADHEPSCICDRNQRIVLTRHVSMREILPPCAGRLF